MCLHICDTALSFLNYLTFLFKFFSFFLKISQMFAMYLGCIYSIISGCSFHYPRHYTISLIFLPTSCLFFNSVRVHCVLMCVCVFVCLFIHVCVCTRVRVHVSVFVCVVPHWDMGNLLMTLHPKRKVAYSLSSHQTKI